MAKAVSETKSQSNRGVFGQGSNFEERFIPDYKRLAQMVKACKSIGLKIVLTMGTFDFIHIGHFLYLEKAKGYGDLLIVGIDSDNKVKARKGVDRPIVSEEERVKMLTHVRHVDVVTIKNLQHQKWELIKTVHPDVLVATANTYGPRQLEALKKYCGKVVVLEAQAVTSTTAKLRRLNIGLASKMKSVVSAAVEEAFDKLNENA